MADEKTFSHITVSADDEDDVVIHAGARTTSHSADSAFDAVEPASVKTTVHPFTDDDGNDEPDEVLVDAPIDEEEPRVAQGDEAFRETRLDDLEAAPMSSLQKGILIAALLLIAGFAVYYIFMR